MPIPEERSRSFLAQQVGSLMFSRVHADSPMGLVRAAAWFNSLTRLGIHLPFFIVKDLGTLLTTSRGPGGFSVRPWASAGRTGALGARGAELDEYVELLESIASSEVVKRLATWRMRDDLVAVLLARILGETYNRWMDPAKGSGAEELAPDLGLYADADVPRHFADFDREPLWAFLGHLLGHSLHVYTCVELIDLDTVKLLGLFREDSASGADALSSAIDLVDLFSALGTPEANDVANFTLDLLPSVLETKRAAGAQVFSVDGYTSLERKGNVDSLVLSELAFDQEIFEQKAVDNELLYYGHERQREDERRLQYILVDSSASMRGRRQVFARGLALTLVKKLSLQGDEVWLRFFDSRLHELHKVARSNAFPVPYLLSFRSENGRNYAKVFRQLALEVTRLRRDHKRQVVIKIITHGQCHIPAELVAALAQEAYLYGIIILPSSELELDYLPMLNRVQIVESSSLASRAGRKDRALDIVDDATAADDVADGEKETA